VITDLFGNEAAAAARILKENGYDKVTVLLEGMDRWLSSDKNEWGCTKDPYVPSASFQIMSAGEFSRFLPANKNTVLIDLRNADEFAGLHKESFRNIGHLQNAINIPSQELSKKIGDLSSYKSMPVVLYGFSGAPEVYAAADFLSKNGFSKVYVLAGGLFNIRWTAANVPGMAFMHDWVKDIPDVNQ
jgi:rhodanese-related sulfurtransferase